MRNLRYNIPLILLLIMPSVNAQNRVFDLIGNTFSNIIRNDNFMYFLTFLGLFVIFYFLVEYGISFVPGIKDNESKVKWISGAIALLMDMGLFWGLRFTGVRGTLSLILGNFTFISLLIILALVSSAIWAYGSENDWELLRKMFWIFIVSGLLILSFGKLLDNLGIRSDIAYDLINWGILIFVFSLFSYVISFLFEKAKSISFKGKKNTTDSDAPLNEEPLDDGDEEFKDETHNIDISLNIFELITSNGTYKKSKVVRLPNYFVIAVEVESLIPKENIIINGILVSKTQDNISLNNLMFEDGNLNSRFNYYKSPSNTTHIFKNAVASIGSGIFDLILEISIGDFKHRMIEKDLKFIYDDVNIDTLDEIAILGEYTLDCKLTHNKSPLNISCYLDIEAPKNLDVIYNKQLINKDSFSVVIKPNTYYFVRGAELTIIAKDAFGEIARKNISIIPNFESKPTNSEFEDEAPKKHNNYETLRKIPFQQKKSFWYELRIK